MTPWTWTTVEPEGPPDGASAVQAYDGWTESMPTASTVKAPGTCRRMHPTVLPPATLVAVMSMAVETPATTDAGVRVTVHPPVAPLTPPATAIAMIDAAVIETARATAFKVRARATTTSGDQAGRRPQLARGGVGKPGDRRVGLGPHGIDEGADQRRLELRPGSIL